MEYKYEGLTKLTVKPSALLTAREMGVFFEAIHEHVREMGQEPEGFTVDIVVTFLEKDK